MLTNQLKTQRNIDLFWKVSIFSFLALIFIALPGESIAGGATSLTSILCNILQGLTGTPAKIIATFAICFLGIAAFFGKLNWGTAMLVGLGIALIFGATFIIGIVAPNVNGNCNVGQGTSF